MSINIVELVKNYLPDGLIAKAASYFGIEEEKTSVAVSALVPSLLAGLLAKATATQDGAENVLAAAKSFHDSGVSATATNSFDEETISSKGLNFFNNVLGNNAGTVTDAVAAYASVPSSSAQSLAGLLMPLIAGAIGKHAAEQGLNASGISHFLANQKNNIHSALPTSLSNIFPHDTTDSAQAAFPGHHHNEAASATRDNRANQPTGGMKWLLPLFLVIALALLIWYMTKGCHNAENTGAINDTTVANSSVSGAVPTATSAGHYDSTTNNYIYNVGVDKEIVLTDGTKIIAGENSTEAKLFKFLSDTTITVDTIDKTKGWISLDRVYFETGKSVLTANSQTQLKNIAAILKNFPTAKVKMGGYTDNTGAPDANIKISGDRAKAAAAELVKSGVATGNVSSEGYGPQHPVCPANDTPECKAQNRRVDIKVAAK